MAISTSYMMQPGPHLRFERLAQRLLHALRLRIANGELTERGLARRLEISQPHMHNLLKGARGLTLGMADRLLDELEMGLPDLITTVELGEALRRRAPRQNGHCHVALAAGRLGPESLFPDLSSPVQWETAAAELVVGWRRPVLVRVEEDEEIRGHLPPGHLALLETDERFRLQALDGSWCALRLGSVGYLRRVRRENGTLRLLGQEGLWPAGVPAAVPLRGASALQVVRGVLVWKGYDPKELFLNEEGILKTASS